MSRAPYWLPGMRWGQRMNNGVAIDPMVGALTDPFDVCHMGVTAENVAADFGVSRADQDALAAESHRRAAAAAAAGYFTEQILPIEIPGKKGTTVVDTDEHVRPGVSLGDMARLRPAFVPDGTVTAGNASGINDAAAAVMLASGSFVASSGADPDGQAGRVRARRGRAADHGHGPGARHAQGAPPRRPQGRRDRRVRGERGLRRPGAGRGQGTGPAAGAHQPERQRHLPRSSRSAPPAPSWPSSPCTSSSAPAAATPWPPCASAADRASRRSSSGSDAPRRLGTHAGLACTPGRTDAPRSVRHK